MIAPLRGLVGDMGGTNARFAIAEISENGAVRLEFPESFSAKDYAGPAAVVRAYLAERPRALLDFAALACAGPVRGGGVRFTNLNWSISEDELAKASGAPRAVLLNDLAAVAWSTPRLAGDDLHVVGGVAVAPDPDGVRAVFNVGTGTNASALVPGPGGPRVVAGEMGHTGLAPVEDIDLEIWRRLKARFGRVSQERVLSGPGLCNLYVVLCELEGVAPADFPPNLMAQRALEGDAVAARTLERFVSLMGAAAGDTALAFGATTGLYIAGGVSPKILSHMDNGAFRAAFEAKGRFAAQMAQIPTFIILHPYAALIGAAVAASQGV